MKCPNCGGMNFDWASSCDHCGRRFDDEAAARPAKVPLPDAVQAESDPEELRHLQFTEALAAATPMVFVTPALIAMNVVVYLAMVASGVSPVSPLSEALIRWGADFGPLTTHGQWWRLLTAMFVHIGAVHLLMNMYVLWVIGRITERLFGNAAFSVLYLGAGLAASFTSVVWHPLSAAAGASGAIFGLYGGLFGFLLIRRASIPSDIIATLSKSGVFFVIANLLYGAIGKGVDVSAHLGGFLSGIPLGCALAVPLTSDLATRLRRSAVVALAATAVAGTVALRIPRVDNWDAEMIRLATLERESAQLYDTSVKKVQSEAMTADEFAQVMEGKLAPAWDAQRTAIAKLRVPEPQRTTARRLANYMALRAESWRLTAEGVRTNNPALIRDGDVKLEAALVALQAVRSDGAIVNQLGRLRAARAAADAFAGEMERVTSAELNGNKVFNDSLARLKGGRISRAQFAETIETQVLPQWNTERDTLSRLKAPEGKEALAKRIVEYMSVKGESWMLASRAIRSDDTGLLRKAAAKQAEAAALAKSMRTAKDR